MDSQAKPRRADVDFRIHKEALILSRELNHNRGELHKKVLLSRMLIQNQIDATNQTL